MTPSVDDDDDNDIYDDDDDDDDDDDVNTPSLQGLSEAPRFSLRRCLLFRGGLGVSGPLPRGRGRFKGFCSS